MKKSNTQLTPEEALRLADRYFEAQTSEEEEERLRYFILTAENADSRFNDVRAVMGVALCPPHAVTASKHKHQHKRIHTSFSVLVKRTAVAASFLLIAGVATTSYLHHENNLCIAYINGQKVTDHERVEKTMHDVLQQMDMSHDQTSPIEEQMSNMFEPLE